MIFLHFDGGIAVVIHISMWINPYGPEIFLYKPIFQFKMIINV